MQSGKSSVAGKLFVQPLLYLHRLSQINADASLFPIRVRGSSNGKYPTEAILLQQIHNVCERGR